ncbi:hypothetical protein G5G77_004584 [Escherichia coli]|nr:hypothetical protein [Escherichia coli]MBS9318679.1 hypothetical protein [Escherichia coli]
MAPDITTGRDPPQRREARFAKRRCPLHPGGFLPGCKAHRQKKNKTDWNQGSSNQSQNRRKKRIITGKVM